MKDLPKQIKEYIKPSNIPDDVEAYMYLITCLDTGMWYLGIHKEDGTVYWHSSENEDFNKKWVDENSRFKYELLEWGSYTLMTAREHQELKKVDAKNNPMSWNQSNGIPRGKTDMNFSQINHILDKIENGDYPTVDLTLNEVKKLKFLQSRMMKLLSKTKVSDGVKGIDKVSSTSNCDPLVLFEDYYIKDNEHCGIGGKHTSQMFIKSKHGKHGTLKAILVPREDYETLSHDEQKQVGHGLNPKPKIPKDPVNVDDLIHDYFGQMQNGREILVKRGKTYIWNKDIKSFMFDTLHLGNSQVRRVKNGIENELKKQNQKSISGLIFEPYDEDSEEVIALSKKYENNPKVKSKIYKSNSVTLGRVVSDCEGYDTIHVAIYHKNPNDEDKWPSLKRNILKQAQWFNNKDKKIIFDEVNHWVDDIS